MPTGMNQNDRILKAVLNELTEAPRANTQREAMTHLLWAKHLLETLLREMQDN